MNKGSAALTGAGTGAAVGTAIMPGIGTAVGAVGGAIGGWLLGDDGSDVAPAYNPNQQNFQYGLGQYVDAQGVVHPTPEERAAAQQQLAQQQRQEQDAMVQQMNRYPLGSPQRHELEQQMGLKLQEQQKAQQALATSGGQDNYAAQRTRETVGRQGQVDALATDAYNRGTPERGAFVGSEGSGLLAGADANGRAQQQQGIAGLNSQVTALNNFANQAEGPSAAQAQLQAGTDQAARQQYSAARSQPGGGGAAMRNAAFNVAGLQGQSANSAAMLRAQETNDYKQRQLAALNSAMGGAGQSAGYSGQLRAGDQAFAQTQAGQANYDAGAVNNYSQQQQAAAQQARAQNDAMTLGAIGSSQAYDQERNQLAAAQTGQGNAYEQAKAAGAGQAMQGSIAQQQIDQQNLGMGLSAASAGLAAYTASQNADGAANARSGTAAGSGAYQAAHGAGTSDERQKKLQRQESSLSAALQTLGNAPGYSYEYKDTALPGTAPGRQVSSMAQDLEKGPRGDEIVFEAPHGKMVDYDAVAKMTPGAITELHNKVNALERALGRKVA